MAGCGCGSGSSVPEVVPIKLRSLDPAALERGRALCRMTAHSQCFASRKAANVAADDACEQPLAGTILGGAARDDCKREPFLVSVRVRAELVACSKGEPLLGSRIRNRGSISDM
jgi:hypothetical protein